MNQPQLFNFNGQPTLDSREVAEMIGKKHAHLMRDIHRYINDMKPNPNLDPAQFFIESNYKDANGQFRPCYLLTKWGCEFVANKKTGKKGKHWVLYHKYDGKGYTQYEPFAYNDNKGVHNNLKWTQRGRKFIYDTLKEHGILPVLEQPELLSESEGAAQWQH